jgi:hypothetical protein
VETRSWKKKLESNRASAKMEPVTDKENSTTAAPAQEETGTQELRSWKQKYDTIKIARYWLLYCNFLNVIDQTQLPSRLNR